MRRDHGADPLSSGDGKKQRENLDNTVEIMR